MNYFLEAENSSQIYNGRPPIKRAKRGGNVLARANFIQTWKNALHDRIKLFEYWTRLHCCAALGCNRNVLANVLTRLWVSTQEGTCCLLI